MLMKAEILEVFDLDGNKIGEQNRSEFYAEIEEEFAKTGKITRQVKSIRMILLNSIGRIYLEKRSKFKEGNAGLYDKTLGGHIPKGYSNEITVVKECSEELGMPAVVLPVEEFDMAKESVNLSIIGIVRKIDHVNNYESVRRTRNGSKIVQPFITTFYIGYYDGSIRFIDGECSGVEVYTKEELQDDIQKNPDKYTEDLKYMMEQYHEFIKPLTNSHSAE